MTNPELLKLLIPILGGFLGAGGIGAYYMYKGNKPKVLAEAKKTEAEVIVTFADGWQKYALNLEKRMSEMETRYEKRIKELEKLVEDKDRAHAKVVIDKDKRIDELEKRVDDLERELEKYQKMETKVEEAKVGLHQDVDKKLESIKNVNEEVKGAN